MGKYKAVSQLAKAAGLPDSTARRYVENFKEFFDSRQQGRKKLYNEEGAETLKEIAYLYEQGLTTEQTREELARHYSQNIEAETREVATRKNSQGEELQGLAEAVKYMAEQQARTNELLERFIAEREQAREEELAELKERLAKLEGHREELQQAEHGQEEPGEETEEQQEAPQEEQEGPWKRFVAFMNTPIWPRPKNEGEREK